MVNFNLGGKTSAKDIYNLHITSHAFRIHRAYSRAFRSRYFLWRQKQQNKLCNPRFVSPEFITEADGIFI